MTEIVQLSNLSINSIGPQTFEIITEEETENSQLLDQFIQEQLASDSDSKTLQFKASSVQSFQDYLEANKYRLDYDTVLKILDSYAKLMLFLERNMKCLVLTDLRDFIVINNSDFIFVNSANIFSLEMGKKTTVIDIPLNLNRFQSPELKKLFEIPQNIDFRAGYFSLASFLCYCLFAETLIDKTEQQIEDLLGPIYKTKLYWFIKRCSIKQPEKRKCIFI